MARLYHVDERRLASWLPPVVWMGVILWLSSGSWSGEETVIMLEPFFRWLLPWATAAQLRALHALIRKLAHLVEYAVLAALWFRALVREDQPARRAAWITLGVTALWAAVDEGRQATQPSRGGSAMDVALDTAGAVIALTVLRGDRRRIIDRAATALLWATAIGGVGGLVVNAIAGVTSIALWITTPVAAAALLIRRRRLIRWGPRHGPHTPDARNRPG